MEKHVGTARKAPERNRAAMGRSVKKSKDLRTGKPDKPTGLSALASTEWDRVLRELSDSGIEVTPGHRVWLEACGANLHDEITQAAARVKKDGAYIVTKAGLVAHPASKRLDALRRDRVKVMSLLGLRAAVATGFDEREVTLDDALGG